MFIYGYFSPSLLPFALYLMPFLSTLILRGDSFSSGGPYTEYPNEGIYKKTARQQ